MPAFDINTAGTRRAIANIQAEIDVVRSRALDFMGDEAVSHLAAPSSEVNVDTGRMRRSYDYRLTPRTVVMTNSATSPQGYPYPVLIERIYGGVARTLTRDRRSIVRNVNRRLERASGRSRNG